MHPTPIGRRVFVRAASGAALAGIVAATGAHAAEPASAFPSRPVKMVVPFPAGQGADTSARALVRELDTLTGQPFVIDNRPGGNNVIGAKAVTTAPADGYTLFYGTNSPMAANAVFFRNLGYDPVKDFTPVAMISRSPWVIVVSADSPIKTFQELVARSKSDPTAVSFGTGATGYQLAAILLTKGAGMNTNIVPYKGSPQVLQDVIGQQVTATMTDFGTLRPLIATGRLRPLLVFDDRKIAALPDVPSLKEAGLNVPPLFSWTGIFAPANTPQPVVDKLAATIGKVLQTENYKAYIAKQGSEIAFAGSAKLGEFQRREVANYAEAMKVGNVEPQ